MNKPSVSPAPAFSVISGAQVSRVLTGREAEVTRVVEEAYLLHGAGRTVNPDSSFLTFPDRPSSRIIALPASVGGDIDVDGIKWISSFPENVEAGIPRASAVLVLNDTASGYPFACLESSVVSAARTAASAALAADYLSRGRGERPARVGFFGAGLIARFLHTYLTANGFVFDEVGIHDVSSEHAGGFRGYLERSGETKITVHESAEELVRSSELVVFATVAGRPHVTETTWFAHNPLVLHISLRDLSPEIVLASQNITDDVEHCMKANTSLHLTEQITGGRGFMTGTLHDVLTGKITCSPERPAVFSPFGLGILDLAVGKYVYDAIDADGELHVVPDFFSDLKRYG